MNVFQVAQGLTAFTNGIDQANVGAGFKETSVAAFVGVIVQAILGVIGVVFLVLMVWGGFLWMTAAGDDKKIKKATDLLFNAIIGLALVIFAYATSVFVLNALQKAI